MPSATTSNFLHTAQMNYLLKGTTWDAPGTLHVALYITVPELDGTSGTEVSTSGTNYGRISITTSGWQGPNGDNLEYSNLADISYLVPTSNWGTIQGAGLYDQPTGGNLFYVAKLTTPKTVNNGDGAPKILAGQLRISRAVC